MVRSVLDNPETSQKRLLQASKGSTRWIEISNRLLFSRKNGDNFRIKARPKYLDTPTHATHDLRLHCFNQNAFFQLSLCSLSNRQRCCDHCCCDDGCCDGGCCSDQEWCCDDECCNGQDWCWGGEESSDDQPWPYPRPCSVWNFGRSVFISFSCIQHFLRPPLPLELAHRLLQALFRNGQNPNVSNEAPPNPATLIQPPPHPMPFWVVTEGEEVGIHHDQKRVELFPDFKLQILTLSFTDLLDTTGFPF